MKKRISRCLDIVRRDEEVLSPCSRSPYYPFVVGSGRGAILTDADGNSYLDFSAASGVLNTGACHPKVVAAVREQAERLLSYTNGYMYEESSVELAEELTRLVPGDFPKSVAFGLSGSDAIDGAIKFARRYTRRSHIVSFLTAYHGATYGALSASAISLNMRRGLGPMLPDFHHFPYPLCHRCAWRQEPQSCDLPCLEEIRTAFRLYLPPEEVAAVLLEPLAGDVGLAVPPAHYVQALAGLCREQGILLVSDEVQQGMGRTGTWTALEHFGVTADVVVLGKGLASGMPLSALVMRKPIGDSLMQPAHCLTLAGNPVCCRAALATIEVIREEGLLEGARERGDRIRERLEEMKSEFPELGPTRGLGLSIGQDFVLPDGKTPDRDGSAKVCHRCWERGLILTFLGDNTLRIQPPLVISESQCLDGLEILAASIRDYRAGKIGDDVLAFARGWA